MTKVYGVFWNKCWPKIAISHTPSSPPLPRCSKKNCVNVYIYVWAEMNRVVLYEQIWIYWLITTRACFWPRTSWGWRMLWSTMQLWWIPGKQQGCSVPNLSGRCLVAPEWICPNCSTSQTWDASDLVVECWATHSRESYMWRNVKRGNDLWSVAYDNVLDEIASPSSYPRQCSGWVSQSVSDW